MQPLTLIVRTAGTNCDRELAHAFELAGARTQTVHLNELIRTPAMLESFDLIGFPGGFSFGDDIAAGRIFANRLRQHLLQPLQEAIRRGVPIIGICNGFQVLVKAGLLPDPVDARQSVTLADNESGRFVDRWVKVQVPQETVCIWTKGLNAFELPVAHGEGRLTMGDPSLLETLKDQGQIALRYAADDNPNASMDDIAGLCDPTGLVLGLMPHPERYTHPTHHPDWRRRDVDDAAVLPGLQMFTQVVEHVRQRGVVTGATVA